MANGVGHVEPEATAGPFCDAAAQASGGDFLAGEPAGQDVDRWDGRPVNGGDVAEVRDARPVLLEHLGGVGVELAVPRDVVPVDLLHGQVETAVATEQRPDHDASMVMATR